MNQILDTSNESPKGETKRVKGNTNKSVETKSVIKFFAIAILIFAAIVIGIVIYSMTKSQNNIIKPTITIENKTDTIILLKVTHQTNISKVEFGWNDEEKTEIQGNSRKYIEQEIKIPTGNNTLYVTAQDEQGQEISYMKKYEVESNIKFEVIGNKIKITYEGETEISYMTYKWDGEEETKIEVDDTKLEQEIDAQRGLHTLTVVVVDKDNNTEIREQKINGVEKPEVKLGVDGEKEHFIITASDTKGLEKVEIRINQDDNQKYKLDLLGKTELDYVVPVEFIDGENFIEVTIYNIDGVTAEAKAKFKK